MFLDEEKQKVALVKKNFATFNFMDLIIQVLEISK